MSKLGWAIHTAAEVHQDQLDKADQPYMLHCIAVMQAVAEHGEDAMCVGILHDALEDCNPMDRVDIEDAIRENLGDRVLRGILSVTKVPGAPYMENIDRAAANALGRRVKIADLTHNMDPRRIPSYQIVDKDFERWAKYRRALVRLEREP